MEVILMLPFYAVLALPGVLALWLLHWVLKKSRWSRGRKIAAFCFVSVILLSPFIMQADVAVVLGPAYLAILPILIDGEGGQFLKVLMSALAVHIGGFVAVTLVSAFVAYRFLFRSS